MGCLFKSIVLFFGGLLVWFIPWVFVLHLGFLVYFPYEPNQRDRFIRVTGPLTRLLSENPDFVTKEEIAPICLKALVAAEDVHFYKHNGLDYESMEKAFTKNQNAKRIKGASTLTQQLVKNAFLSREKTYIRKSREAVGALLLDLILSKEQQLVWYLNIVEMGPKIYGIKEAAWHYFKKSPKQLSKTQCMALMAILPDPNKTYLSVQNKRTFRQVEERKKVMMQNLRVMQTP